MLGRLLPQGAKAIRGFLTARPGTNDPSATFKVKARLKLRCHSCYFLRVDGRLHVECHENPRHKAREVFDVKSLW